MTSRKKTSCWSASRSSSNAVARHPFITNRAACGLALVGKVLHDGYTTLDLLLSQAADIIAVMSELNDQLLREIVDRLVEVLEPREIYLFGSQASGKTHKHSDLDLFVVMDDEAGDLHELAGRGYLALPATGISVDLVLYRRQSVEKWTPVKFSLPYEVRKKGKRIYAA